MSWNKQFKWKFLGKTDNPTGFFFVKNANRINRLYFPLFNMQGMMSAITPELKGDIKTGQNTFLTEPQVTESILHTKNSRNFWVKTKTGKVWSVTGMSARELAEKAADPSRGNMDVKAGPGYFTILHRNEELELDAEITCFIPPAWESFEIMLVKLTNWGGKLLTLTPTAAIPLYGRSADNLRDHRQVTNLLNRIRKNENGIVLQPTMSFDERGHKPNPVLYSAHGFGEEEEKLSGVMGDLETFIGEGGSLEAPEAIFSAKKFFKDPENLDGRDAIAALRFKTVALKENESVSYVVVLGIHPNKESLLLDLSKCNSVRKAEKLLQETKEYWQNQVERLKFFTGDSVFDNWMVWVSLQPLMRRVFGCSFLPDFGYGRGGRGWRDLWQDCLAIILTNPREAREMLLNNIGGVRIDGSNATIIGSRPGEFIADRNNIPRTWMDHGVWPLLTIDLYIQQTGDADILLEKRPFFRDALIHRCKQFHSSWSKDQGCFLTDKNGDLYKDTVFLHLLVQNLTQFYNRGVNGNIRLEDADWNDGLDMAHDKGESVPFTAAYAGNIETLAAYVSLLKEKGMDSMDVPCEILQLIEPDVTSQSLNDSLKLAEVLHSYLMSVENGLSGEIRSISLDKLQTSLREKAVALATHVREKEFMATGRHEYFNGYYNNDGERVDGLIEGREQMSLTGQVFPIMSGVATLDQARKSYQAAKDLLKDKKLGGYRLNTDFGKMMLNLGRAYSFSYGDKENGAFFSHMAVMFGNSLYRRGLVEEGFDVLNSIYQMSSNTKNSLIFPCIPEYFNGLGRGLYCYITGSASWMVMTYVIEVFGIRGTMGRLTFAPRLLARQFSKKKEIGIQTLFQGKNIKVVYKNPKKFSFGKYRIEKITLNGHDVPFQKVPNAAVLPENILHAPCHHFEFHVTLG
ncbi:MAG: cellobiose phosphorylase [Candidatus Aureabacteria bacterium]|nr:cellobiose phosphorylase [Candidatus Auribacterota bacterium]